MTKRRAVFLLSVSLFMWGSGFAPVEAARKYYPPGFVQPDGQETPSGQSEAPMVTPQGKQVIIKKVPVLRSAKPKDPLAVLMDEHRYYDAMRLVEARLKKTPNSSALLLTRALIFREEKQYRQAVEQYQALLSSRSQSVRASAWNGLGWTYYKKALHEGPSGNVHAFQSDIHAAESAFRQASQLAPRLVYVWAGWGEALLAREKIDEAEAHIQKAMRLAPGNTVVRLAQARLLLAQDKPREALDILYGLKKNTTHEPNVYLLLAQASLDTDRVDDAIINLKQLLELLPEHTEALRMLSHTYERKMKLQDAEQTLEKAISINPADEQSVAALLKILDQRQQPEHGILLLKGLIKERPDQPGYALALMQRLAAEGRWAEAYDDGLKVMGPVLASASSRQDGRVQPVIDQFARVVYQRGKGMLNRQELLAEPVVQQVRTHILKRFQQENVSLDASLGDRLNLLLLDPMVVLPLLPSDFKPDEKKLDLALQAAFLEGNQPLHDTLLTRAANAPQALNIAQGLYELGDYPGAARLAQAALERSPEAAQALQAQINTRQRALEEHLDSLEMLPRRISASYLEKAASDALKTGSGYWKTHAVLAKLLDDRHDYPLALIHQKLAAQYAPDDRKRRHWMDKAERTARRLKRDAKQGADSDGTLGGGFVGGLSTFFHLLHAR